MRTDEQQVHIQVIFERSDVAFWHGYLKSFYKFSGYILCNDDMIWVISLLIALL
ncbi:hypothetical protein DFQ00_107161 [Paenibacillus barcinonensis]|uniref:Uncharacterized protein n=1 Tax=Paenibacillus barcinonensis TaxID=198119 RepID=A0A2V4VIM6_PAEBA|nr:hypothetical protein DFQ00_107161 [Paenibacillus barcinonensis]